MDKFTQKYTIVQLLKDLPDGYEYSMKDWPLHVTLADIFAIDGKWSDVLEDLGKNLYAEKAFSSRVTERDLFGENRSVKVKLLENSDELQSFHEKIISILEKHGAKFNSPQHTRAGFRPHVTDQVEQGVQIGDSIEFNAITLIDMFPDKNPYQRRVLGTVHFG